MEIKFKAVMQRLDGEKYVSNGYGADTSFLSYLFDFENNRWDEFLEIITTEQKFVNLFPDDDEHLKGWSHIENIQYSGFKDKNNVEIYNGDIVRVNKLTYDKNNEFEPFVSKVEFYMGSFHLDVKKMLLLSYGKEMEVIGNIYENPELLKENQGN